MKMTPEIRNAILNAFRAVSNHVGTSSNETREFKIAAKYGAGLAAQQMFAWILHTEMPTGDTFNAECQQFQNELKKIL